ncbi:MAG: SDR family NAD(P)-dependent oxidoreductase [Acidobacteriia bacterium]|nr:SDR family NAD(P)-dependent oxidoreductase [Terriglobia bacterium]
MPTALVTGASRGVGKGIAISLAAAGYVVYATGRSIEDAALPDGIIRLVCDHADDKQTESVFAEIPALDILVNNAWGGYERMVEDGKFTWGLPFWQQPLHRWTSMLDVGVRAAFVCGSNAAKLMVPQRSGLIVNIGFWAAQKYVGNTIYGVAKAATDKLAADMAHDLRPHGVAAVSLYPGLVRTEAILEVAAQGWLSLENSESRQYIGLVIAALAKDPDLMSRSGQVLIAAALGAQYELVDTDGKIPRPLSLAEIP